MKTHNVGLALSMVILSGLVAYAEPDHQPFMDLEPVELQPVMVQGMRSSEDSLTQPSFEVQSADLQRVPGGVSLIDETQFKTGRSSTIVDILKNQPGLIVGTRGSGDEAKISIRGSAVDRNFHLRGIRLLQDGIPMTMADGNADFQWLEPFAIQNVEVYRGGNALQYGATTLGGAINFISQTGYTASGLQARTETGSNGYIKGQVSSGMVLGKLDYYASGSAFYQNGFQEHSRSRAQRYMANIGYRFNEDLETRFYGGYVHSKLQLPGSLTPRELSKYARSAAPNSLDFDEQHNIKQLYLANKTTKRFGENQQVEASVYWIHHQLDHPLFWNPFFLNGLGVLDQRANTYGTHWRYTNQQDLLGRQNRLVLGLNPHLSFWDNQRFQNLSGRRRGLRTASSGEFAANFDVYAENQHYVLKNLALVAGGQASYSVRNYNDRFNRNPNGNQTRNQDYFSVNPKVGLLYQPTPSTQVYANYNRSFEPPTMLEIVQLGGVAGNVLTARLKAQTANTIEFGTRGNWKKVAWDTTFYRSWVKNELLTLNDALGNPQGTNNGSKTYHQGVEAAVSIVLAEGLLTRASKLESQMGLSAVGPGLMPEASRGKDRLVLRQVYDWTALRFKDDPVYGGNRLPGLPRQLLRSELIYEHPSGFYLQPNLEWSMARYPVDYANSLNVNPYALLGVRTGYRSKRGWSAFVEFRNLTNKRYPAAVQVVADARTSQGQPRVFSPGQGFSVYGGVELRW